MKIFATITDKTSSCELLRQRKQNCIQDFYGTACKPIIELHEVKQALQNSCELLRHAHGTLLKLMKLHGSSWNCMVAIGGISS